MSKKEIFLIHHHKNFSGAARSLGELIKSLEKKINFFVICPEGSSSKYFKEINIKVFNVMMVPRFNHFELGYYRGIRWFLLFRELIAFIYFFCFLIKLKIKQKKISIFHLNEIELVICAPLLKLFFNSKITSHLRCPLEMKEGKLRRFFLKKLCKKYLFKIIAIDCDCYKNSPLKKNTKIIYNGINEKNLKIKKNKSRNLTFGFIGSFINRKGIYEVLTVFKKLDKKINVKLICVGKVKKENFILNLFNFEKNFHKFIKKNEIHLCNNIKILLMTFNLKKFYSKIDVILFPGYMNAVGRPVIEASLLKKPSIIALKNHNKDTAVKNTCLVFEPGNLLSLEKKIMYLHNNRSLVKKMGLRAFSNAKKNFYLKKNKIKFYKIFKDLD